MANAVNEIAAPNRIARWKDRVQRISEGRESRTGQPAERAGGCLQFETAGGSLGTALLLCAVGLDLR